MPGNDAPARQRSISPGWSRRAVLTTGAATGLATALGGCGFFTSGATAVGDTVTFWDMPWGSAEYSDAAREIVEGYSPVEGNLPAAYQTIQWNGFLQTFTSAVASNTNPAVSSGAGFQAFQFAETGAIHMADAVVERMRTSGRLADFLPGLVEGLRTAQGQVALPWNVDIRPMWFRRSVLEEAGVAPPRDWDEWREVAAALQKIGTYGFAMGAGAGNNSGKHALISLMINNGGGLFDEDGNPDALYERNIEAMEFVREFITNGWIDPAALSYTSDNQRDQWIAGSYALGFDLSTLTDGMGEVEEDFEIADLVHGPHGDTGTLQFVNNLMMYSNNPSVESTEAFLEYYVDSLHELWDQDLIGQLPVLRSITESDAVQNNRFATRMLDVWQPVARQLSQRSETPFAALATLDGGTAITRFVQTMLSEDGDATTALTGLQNGLETATN